MKVLEDYKGHQITVIIFVEHATNGSEEGLFSNLFFLTLLICKSIAALGINNF